MLPPSSLVATRQSRGFTLFNYAQPSSGLPLKAGEQRAVTTTFFAALLPFCLDGSIPQDLGLQAGATDSLPAAMFSPRGLKVPASLAEDLAQASPPTQATEHWPLLREHTWYLDLPHRALLLDESHQIRAVFTQPTPLQEGAVAAVAVITAPGSDRMLGRYAWMLTSEELPYGQADIPLDRAEVRCAVSDFIQLVLLYRATLEQEPVEFCPGSIRARSANARKPRRATRLIVCSGSPSSGRQPIILAVPVKAAGVGGLTTACGCAAILSWCPMENGAVSGGCGG
ncbi:hypothetical protein Nhal_4027 (plasmid) [Nitrosococcus halophilus Nc 4]|uniref:Uncharacterized protein n=1 Tax=Nitrosococcus halophilus (strain Nc4) TaxID=472759 RepID=D5C5I0_NITHN|nr:hypothetical protein [Nitrosococcus halophilus]ADE17034.1 hypothetical protein Nhal_4027 [Nitrosococcus halophilus Nc 4]